MTPLALACALVLSTPSPAAAEPRAESASSEAPSEAQSEPATPRVPELVSAGAATAGFVGGALLAVPALFSVLPLGGPLVAAPVAIAILGAGAGFGGFLGALLEARVAPSLGAGGIAAGLSMAGAGLFVGAAVLATSTADGPTAFLAALGAGAVGGLAGAAVGGALGVWIVKAPEPAPTSTHAAADATPRAE